MPISTAATRATERPRLIDADQAEAPRRRRKGIYVLPNAITLAALAPWLARIDALRDRVESLTEEGARRTLL